MLVNVYIATLDTTTDAIRVAIKLGEREIQILQDNSFGTLLFSE